MRELPIGSVLVSLFFYCSASEKLVQLALRSVPTNKFLQLVSIEETSPIETKALFYRQCSPQGIRPPGRSRS
jgi:hypothetical protein